jgi:hypothetical protein
VNVGFQWSRNSKEGLIEQVGLPAPQISYVVKRVRAEGSEYATSAPFGNEWSPTVVEVEQR